MSATDHSISNSSDCLSLLDHARQMVAHMPVECFPCAFKEPIRINGHHYRWRENALGVPGIHMVDREDLWQAATAYAVTPVIGSCLAIVDVDTPTFLPELFQAVPRLQNTFTVSRGSHRHFYFLMPRPLDQAIRTIKRGGAEVASLRGPGAYVIGPGSLHPSGDTYLILNDADLAEGRL